MNVAQKLLIDCTPGPLRAEPQMVPLNEEEIQQRLLDGAEATNRQIRFLRGERDGRLAASDWTALPDAPLSARQKLAWTAYRTALRDLPATTDPLSPRWPEPPS